MAQLFDFEKFLLVDNDGNIKVGKLVVDGVKVLAKLRVIKCWCSRKNAIKTIRK